MNIQHRWWIDVFDEAAKQGEMSQFTFIEISLFHNLGVIIFCASPKFKENEWMPFDFTCYKCPFKTICVFFLSAAANNKAVKIEVIKLGGFWQRNCCINFSTVSSLLGSNVPCNKAIRNINVPTSDPGSRNFRWRKVNICHPQTYSWGKKKSGEKWMPAQFVACFVRFCRSDRSDRSYVCNTKGLL